MMCKLAQASEEDVFVVAELLATGLREEVVWERAVAKRKDMRMARDSAMAKTLG